MENVRVLNEFENKLFNRKEISLEIETKITPKTEEIKKLISDKFSLPAGNVEMKKINGKFGSNNFIINAFVYNSEEDKNKIENKNKKTKSEKPAK
ncbi:MAG: hypothetical protein ABIH49_00850 [archaeon]